MAHSIAHHGAGAQAPPAIRRIGLADLREALSRGVDDFLATPTQLVFLALIYPVVGLLAARLAWGGNAFHLIYPLVMGFALLGPVGSIGLYEISRRREAGEATSWLDAIKVLRSPAILSVLALGMVLVGIFVAWLLVAQAIYDAAFPAMRHASLGALLRDVIDTPEGRWMILAGNAVGLVFAAVVLAISVVAFPLMLDRQAGVGEAVATSLRAVMANPGTMLAWGLMVLAGFVLGCLPLFVGLAVVMPILGHATWHLYRRLLEAP